MPQFTTSTGRVNVGDWGYQLQSPGGLNAASLAQKKHDLVVMDFSRDGTGAEQFSSGEISQIKDGAGGRSLAVSYLSIGEASEFRDHWDAAWTSDGSASGALTGSAPDWLGPTNPDWPESRKVRFWDEEWQDHIFNDGGTGWLDQIVDQGFDAAYLDIVDAYYYWAREVPNGQREAGDPAKGDEADAAARMIDFIVEMTAHARETNPEFFVILQNGGFILDALEGADPARKAALLDAVGGIAVEDLYFRGGREENNRFRPDHDRIDVLQRDFLKNGVPVFVVDYVNNGQKLAKFEQQAIGDGFIPYAAPDRELDSMGQRLGLGGATKANDFLTGNGAANAIKGRAGHDIIEGYGGGDRLVGGTGHDWLYGGDGDDRLLGGKGRDVLTGGDGDDVFKFAPRQGRDQVLDFADGDVIDLTAFGFRKFAHALAKAYEIGSANNDVMGISHKGTKIIIKGLDRGDFGSDDMLI